jgi:hypothetical protein
MLAVKFGAKVNPQIYGNLIIAFFSFGYLFSAFFDYKGGLEYKKYQEKVAAKKSAA